jgi:hypothetical protein
MSNKQTIMKRTMNQVVVALFSLMASGSVFAASPYIDLHTLFDTDVFLETGGVGLGNPLDANGSRVDSGTLPASYTDGAPIATQDGRATFMFGNFKQSSLDGVMINGQSINVQAGQYASLDLALLDAPNAFAWPFDAIEFRYTDGSKDTNQFGPVAGWFNSPTAFDHAILAATDNSAVTTYASFPTDFSAEEAVFLYQESGNGNANPWRFVDAGNYVVYKIPVPTSLAHATLGVTVGNDFVISVATSFTPDNDPANSPDRTNGWTLLENSSTLYGHSEHNLANLKEYTFDAAAQLAAGTGELYVLLTDATPNDGWGPYIQHIRLYTGIPQYFSQRIDPAVDTSRTTVYAMFDVGTTNETPYLYDNTGSGPSNRGHRYADASGYLTYRFALPTNTANAKLTMDMANNFVVSLRGPGDPVITYDSVVPFTQSESNHMVDISCCTGNDGGNRFMDGNNYVVYQFTLPAGVSNALARINIGNEYLVQMRSGTNGEWTTELSTLDRPGPTYYDVDLSKYLSNNSTIQVWVGDNIPTDGWGGYLKGMTIVNHLDAADWQTVLNSQTLFGEDVHNEYNKSYYTLDLSSVLSNNPTKEVFVKLTDGSTGDGWGPGIFWMAAYSGTINIQSDRLVFNGLKSTQGEPTQNYGLDFLQRRYPLNASKTLSSIVLPAKPTDSSTTNSLVYLLAATLNVAAPTLGIALQLDNTVRLSWTTNASDYNLQSTTGLVTPIWQPVTGTPVVVGDQNTVTQPVAGTKYYRLAK